MKRMSSSVLLSISSGFRGLWFLVAGAVFCAVCGGAEENRVLCTNDLTTSWGRAVTPENVWREYPRPQLVRGNWMSLNGTWEYALASAAADEPAKYDGTILVPFGVETPLSGVKRTVTPEDQIWYRRAFTLHLKPGFRTLLHFERVDFRAQVFVNGREVTDVPHEGGNVPFSVDATAFVKDGENELKLLVWDPTDTHLGGTGKQVLKLTTCFFPATSGICGSVWYETVPETYLADYKVETDIDKGTVTVTPFLKGSVRTAEVTVAASFNGNSCASAKLAEGAEAVTLSLPRPLRLWSCDTPNLYDLSITVAAKGQTDKVTGYFGMRKVETKLDVRGIRRAAVNGKFTYFLATLDQGWWPDGYLTPPSEDALRFDVDFHKKAGFNSIRKHIKIEPRAFYAYCDKVGVMVLQDIPSCRPDHLQHDIQFSNRRYGFYRQELKEIVDHLRNHPCIVMWIPFNEGWGQPSADKTRFTNLWLKRYDPSRLVNGPSGWNDYEGGFAQGYTKWKQPTDPTPSCDVVDRHHYPDAKMFEPNAKRMTMAGEFGGLGACLKGHYQDPKGRLHTMEPVEGGTWRERNRKNYEHLARPLIDMARRGLGGSVFTESIDQFWEGGGFVTFDRAIEKLDYDFLRKLHKEILDAAYEAATTPKPPAP
ncbi:MAG: beta galactosidase jelly roll domain-containing protein [Kiritimatiellae bacterium]|nr:beta galactosidase jelly roll domain-containing protein [Kiritimatiellia bacterium]